MNPRKGKGPLPMGALPNPAPTRPDEQSLAGLAVIARPSLEKAETAWAEIGTRFEEGRRIMAAGKTAESVDVILDGLQEIRETNPTVILNKFVAALVLADPTSVVALCEKTLRALETMDRDFAEFVGDRGAEPARQAARVIRAVRDHARERMRAECRARTAPRTAPARVTRCHRRPRTRRIVRRTRARAPTSPSGSSDPDPGPNPGRARFLATAAPDLEDLLARLEADAEHADDGELTTLSDALAGWVRHLLAVGEVVA